MTQQLHPNVLWAQRKDKLFLTIDIQVCGVCEREREAKVDPHAAVCVCPCPHPRPAQPATLAPILGV